MKYDYENVLEYAVEQGEARGRAEGIAEGETRGRSMGLVEGKRETAKNLLSLGDSVEKIAIVTGLSVEEVRSL